MTIVIFILPSIFRGGELLRLSHISIYENSRLKAFKHIKFFDETSYNWPNDLLGKSVCKTLESC